MRSLPEQRIARLAGLAAPLLFMAAAGCGGASDNGDAAPPFAVCAHETRADSYSAGMLKTGKNGNLTAELLSSDPGPPIRGSNAWRLMVKDSAGNPVDGATIAVTPYMPDHSHGTSVRAVVCPGVDDACKTAAPLPSGTYSIAPLYLFMAGLWQTTLDIRSADDTVTDSVVFSFCVDG